MRKWKKLKEKVIGEEKKENCLPPPPFHTLNPMK